MKAANLFPSAWFCLACLTTAFSAPSGEIGVVKRIISNEGTVSMEVPAAWTEIDNSPDILAVIPAAGDDDSEMTAGISVMKRELQADAGLADFTAAWKRETAEFGCQVMDEYQVRLDGHPASVLSFVIAQDGVDAQLTGKAYLTAAGAYGYEIVASAAGSDAGRWLPLLETCIWTFKLEDENTATVEN